MVRHYFAQMALNFPLSDGTIGGAYHGVGLYGIFPFLQDMQSYSVDFYLASSILVETLWVLYADYKQLTDRYIALRLILPNGQERTRMSDREIDEWRFVLRAKVHHAMAKLALTLPITLREAEKREVDAETGSQSYTQRERALWETLSFTQEPTGPLLASYRQYWLKTPVISIVGSCVHAMPFHAHDYPP